MAQIELKVKTNADELRAKIEQLEKLVMEINSFELKVEVESIKSE